MPPPQAATMPPRFPNPTNLPKSVRFTPKDHILSYSKSYPSGPQQQLVRLKYPYMAAQTLADNIAHNAGEEKTSQILNQLFQAMGNVGTGRNARPVTGVHIKISGTSHVEKTFTTTVQFRRGSMANGVRDHKMKTICGRMGSRTTQVMLCSAAFPF
ncbi:hypothetical protein BDY24DRAFT_412668 [Mrakia frigida]|uniref:uncharacterized protein n=1 Tax=Mrakia frigida TaxID=29902 RepID=UPI003FCC1A3F